MTPDLIILIGPESTGTRVFTRLLSQHKRIVGSPEAAGHFDVLDGLWSDVQNKAWHAASEIWERLRKRGTLLTRRSMPHSRVVGTPAAYMEFPNLKRMAGFLRRYNLRATVLITTRSPGPHLESWVTRRASPGGEKEKARAMYQAAYRSIFEFIAETDSPFYFLSLEALALEGSTYIESLLALLGFAPQKITYAPKPDLNRRYYEQDRGEVPPGGSSADS